MSEVGVVAFVAAKFGAPEPAFRLLLTILAGLFHNQI